MDITDFDDFDAQSQEELRGYNFLSLDDIERGIVGDDPFEGIRTNKSAQEIKNEIALETPFGKRSLFYKADLKEINKGQLNLNEFLSENDIVVPSQHLFRLNANDIFVNQIKEAYTNELLCGTFDVNITTYTYSGLNAAKKQLETYSNNYTWFFEDNPKALNFFLYRSPFKNRISAVVVDIGSDFFDCIKSVGISKEKAIDYLMEAFQLAFNRQNTKDTNIDLGDVRHAINAEFKAEEDYQNLTNMLLEQFDSQPAVTLLLGLSLEWTEELREYRIDKKHYLPEEKDFQPIFFNAIKNELKSELDEISIIPKELQDDFADLIVKNNYAVNALCCGIINAVIDEAESITELPQFFYDIFTNRASLKTFIRSIKEVLDNKLDFIIKTLKKLKTLHLDGSVYQFCYQIGYDMGFIMSTILTAAIGKIVKSKKISQFFVYLKKIGNHKVFELAYRAGCAIEVDGKELVLTYNGIIIAKGSTQKLTKKLEKLLEIKRNNPNVGYAFIGFYKLDNLIKLRRSHKSLYNANIATMKVRIKEAGKPVMVLEFKAQSGRNNKISGSNKVKERYKGESENHRDNDGVKRWNDSEHKMFRDLQDNHLDFAKGLNIENISIEIEMYSIYHPCGKCQEVISNFQRYYNAKIKVWSTEARHNDDFIDKYPKGNTKNN